MNHGYNITRWEYNGLLLSSRARANIIELDNMGNEGWELVTVDAGVAYMKRQLGDEA